MSFSQQIRARLFVERLRGAIDGFASGQSVRADRCPASIECFLQLNYRRIFYDLSLCTGNAKLTFDVNGTQCAVLINIKVRKRERLRIGCNACAIAFLCLVDKIFANCAASWSGTLKSQSTAGNVFTITLRHTFSVSYASTSLRKNEMLLLCNLIDAAAAT